MQKMMIAIMIALLAAGCSIRSKSYYILDGKRDNIETKTLDKSIGIETIVLPHYFDQSAVAVKTGNNKIAFLPNAIWVSDMDAHLTDVLISYLKRYFHSTNVYLYPWDVSKKIDQKVHIKIDNFIYHDKMIELDASWEITTADGRKKAHFLHIKVPSDAQTDAIVKQMDEAFSKLELAVAESLS